jgi:acyl-coenzyme A thioesterase PaaI-like protein
MVVEHENYEKLTRKIPPLPNSWIGNCFGCSNENDHGLHLKFWPIPQGCVSKFNFSDTFCGFNGIVHGGILATVLDEAAAWAILIHNLTIGFTKSTTIQYLRPVSTNTEVLIVSKIIQSQNSQVKVLSIIQAIDGKLFTKAESEWILPGLSLIASKSSIDETLLSEMVSRAISPIINYLEEYSIGA